MKIVIRTDASFTIGSGHIMRCLTLAALLRGRGADVLFICREHDGHFCNVIEEQGFSVCRLPTPTVVFHVENDLSVYNGWLGATWQEDFEQTRSVINQIGVKPDWLVVDHYALDISWESKLSEMVGRIMVIDDLADRSHNCNILLDQNLVADMYTRYSEKVPASCNLLIGAEYALLQPIYTELHDRSSVREGKIRRILIFFGGADNDNLTGRILAVFLSLNQFDVKLDVVVSQGSVHLESIRKQVLGKDNINLYNGLPTLAPLMVKADLAIGAGGATNWERLCLGLPALIITIADNQRLVAEELNARGLVKLLGHKDQIDDASIFNTLKSILARSLEPEWSIRCRNVLDGTGANLVANIMLDKLLTTKKSLNKGI